MTRGQDGKKFVLTPGQDDFQIGLEGGTLIILVKKNLRNFLREVLPGEISMPSFDISYQVSFMLLSLVWAQEAFLCEC